MGRTLSITSARIKPQCDQVFASTSRFELPSHRFLATTGLPISLIRLELTSPLFLTVSSLPRQAYSDGKKKGKDLLFTAGSVRSQAEFREFRIDSLAGPHSCRRLCEKG